MIFMPTRDQVLESLRVVIDPELRRDIVELEMVRSIELREGGVVDVVVSLTTAGCPIRNHFETAVANAVGGLEGVERVNVTFDVLSDNEKGRLQQKLGRAGLPEGALAEVRNVICVASGKGGVGKSSVTTNLTIALAKAGYSVAAVDADVWGFSMPRMLGIDRPPVVIDTLIVPPSAHGVKLVSMGFFAREDQPVIWRGPMLHKALEQFLTDVWWGEPQFLVIDMPPGTGDVALSMAQFIPRAEVVVVTTPQPAAQKVAQRAAYMAQKVNLTVTGVIENMSWFRGDDGKAYEIFGSGGGTELADSLGVPLLGRVPLVPELREGGDVGRPITVSDPDCEASQVFTEIARRLYEDLAPRRVYRSELKLI
jgi:ATP-binding protein involved in chromosome partitioning